MSNRMPRTLVLITGLAISVSVTGVTVAQSGGGEPVRVTYISSDIIYISAGSQAGF